MSNDSGLSQATPEQILAFIHSIEGGGLTEQMGITITEADFDHLVGTMPVEGNTQPYGFLHGGASAVLAETLGSIGAAVHAGPNRFPVGIELSCSHHLSATKGIVTGVARPVRIGSTLSTWEIVITDDADRRLCTARLTCLVRDRI